MSEEQPRVTGRPFQPGQSGNPAGRPKGSRNKLGEDFLRELAADFSENGKKAIAAVREKEPGVYLRVVASLLPKIVEVQQPSALDELDDDALRSVIDAVRSSLGVSASGGNRTGEPDGAQPSEGLSAVH